MMKLLVGLGNPGREYLLTRHNIGFMVIDELVTRYSLRPKKNYRFKAVTAEGVIEGENCYLAKPQRFMNLSGNSVRSIVNWLKIDPSELLVIADDVNLPFGTIRIRPKGSHGGHRGLESVIDCLASNEFARMRIGILGDRKSEELSEYVLDKFTREEKRLLRDILTSGVCACACWVREGIQEAMNKYNKKIDGGQNE